MPSIEYSITPLRPEAHVFRVVCSLEQPAADGQRFSLPAWIPGSYLVRDFARHVISVSAQCEGEALTVTKTGKQTWACEPCAGRLEISCDIHAHDTSVRAAYLDTRRGFFNGTSVFLRPENTRDWPCRVTIGPPPEPQGTTWQVASTLVPVDVNDNGFGAYQASSYDDLIDHPVAMGEVELLDFFVQGKPHGIALLGRHDADGARLTRDLEQVCTQHARLFGELPVEGYLFLAQVTGEGYGGLEHRDCCVLQVARNSLPAPGTTVDKRPDEYLNMLGLCSHEYFHLWNVKRIRPRAVAESDLLQEAHFRDLWAYEGVTSYYDDLALVRADILAAETYLENIARLTTRLEQSPGRLHQSLADSSFDAWTKFYKPDANSPNSIVSYYGKGAIVALCLDLNLRRSSRNRLSLDQVMQQAWARFGSPDIPVPDGGLERLVVEMGGPAFAEFFERYVHGTEDPPLTTLLSEFAVTCRRMPADEAGKDPALKLAALGVRLEASTSEARVKNVIENTNAQTAGLSPGDVLVAIDGLRVTPANLPTRLERIPPGVHATLQFFREDELLSTELEIPRRRSRPWRFSLNADAPEAALRRRKAWLGGSHAK